MPRYEYKLVPAPERATRQKGLKGAASFAATLEEIFNELGREGWHYLRTDTLPQEERSGLTSRTTSYRNLMVFQRELPEAVPVRREPGLASPRQIPAPDGPPGEDGTADWVDQPQPSESVPAEAPSDRPPRFARRPLVADRKPDGTP